MNKIIPILLSASIASGAFLVPTITSAQDVLKKRENTRYYRVINLDFKPGHTDAAWDILYDKIAPAVRAMDKDFVALDWESGPWDSTVYITLDEGYGSLEYATSPQNAAFMASLAKLQGGEDAAKKVMQEWASHIDNDSTGLAHMHLPPPTKDK
ncbi:MAG: hypothetical protein Q9M33_08305 [Robiginitomaculum sp.]|nr:hypothetical protein [Robiginitomaculum sp.]MDQ7077972.1 hypothetical protein [Robiginitomaculum sp.]